MKFRLFNRATLNIKPLTEREHDLDMSIINNLNSTRAPDINKGIQEVVERIICAKENESAIILMFGAHVIRSGVQNYIIDLMERGYISCISTNGASIIHDFELAMIETSTGSSPSLPECALSWDN